MIHSKCTEDFFFWFIDSIEQKTHVCCTYSSQINNWESLEQKLTLLAHALKKHNYTNNSKDIRHRLIKIEFLKLLFLHFQILNGSHREDNIIENEDPQRLPDNFVKNNINYNRLTTHKYLISQIFESLSSHAAFK